MVTATVVIDTETIEQTLARKTRFEPTLVCIVPGQEVTTTRFGWGIIMIRAWWCFLFPLISVTIGAQRNVGIGVLYPKTMTLTILPVRTARLKLSL
jgi:hypothetical protein